MPGVGKIVLRQVGGKRDLRLPRNNPNNPLPLSSNNEKTFPLNYDSGILRGRGSSFGVGGVGGSFLRVVDDNFKMIYLQSPYIPSQTCEK